MLGKWFERALSAGKSPIVVSWSENVQGHTVSREEAGILKQIVRPELCLTVFGPTYQDDKTQVRFVLANTGDKAIGLAARGVGLTLTSKHSQVSSLTAKFLDKGLTFEPGYQPGQEDLLVDTCEQATITALFAPALRPEYANLVIQANRIMAASYLFVIPFAGDPQLETVPEPKAKIVRYFFEVQCPDGSWRRTADSELYKTEEEAGVAGGKWGGGKWPHRVGHLELNKAPWYEQ